MEKKGNKLSESFVIGVIALVFLIVGYQTALFVYRASVMKIVSNRDEPDTVFVYRDITKEQDGYSSKSSEPKGDSSRSGQSASKQTIVKKSPHSPIAESVRRTAPRKKTESFRFDPNTVTVEELCRLGFSEKQAQSIENYRLSGGTYRRKSDFAKSFVVSDSIYKRLEPYIDIPLVDLNLADSAEFDSLPGIGGWFAKKMVEHRAALGGYSYKEQLLDIYKFTEEKYQALEDLVTVSPEYVTPYPLWTLSADSLRKHPYIKDYETARSIVLYRDNSAKSELTIADLQRAGILSPDSADRLSKCKIRSP